jgi:hypothetical protein
MREREREIWRYREHFFLGGGNVLNFNGKEGEREIRRYREHFFGEGGMF